MANEISDASPFVSTDWLEKHLGTPGLVIIDASWHLPAAGRDARAEYLDRHIPGAVFFDIDEISDKASPLPHMLPGPVPFSSAMRALGIGDGMKIVVYDSVGVFSAPRVRWTLKTFGVTDVTLLAGGLPKWIEEGRITQDGPVLRQPRHFSARLNNGAVAQAADISAALASGSAQVIDARAKSRFEGSEPEPRHGLRAGHMPGALNLPWTTIVENGALKPPGAIATAFEAAGVDLAKPIITTCGSGISAAILALGLETIGHPIASLYDGSWTEWGGQNDLPVATGAATKPLSAS